MRVGVAEQHPFSLFCRSLCLLLLQCVILVGSSSLHAQQRQLNISGTVRDANTGVPVVAAIVIYDSLIVARTDESGRYEVSGLSVSGSRMTLLFQRLGYMTTTREVDLSGPSTDLRVDVSMGTAPTDLEPVVVAGQRDTLANPGLIGFHQRRELGIGTYLNEEEIRRSGVRDLSNHLRRLRVHYSGGCVVAYVDGIRNMSLANINEWVPPSQLGGIEFYRNNQLAQLPEGLIRMPERCDVILFWSRRVKRVVQMKLALHTGTAFDADRSVGWNVGGQIILRSQGEAGTGTLRLRLAVDAKLKGDGRLWQGLLGVTFKPFGFRSPFYVGAGVGVAREDYAGPGVDPEKVTSRYAVISGLTFDDLPLSPYLEVRAYDIATPNRMTVATLIGVSRRFGGF